MEKKTSDDLNERGKWVKVGGIPFYLRPITFGQKWDVEATVGLMKAFKQTDNITAELFKAGAFSSLIELVPIIMFRTDLFRFLFGWYVKRNVTNKVFNKVFTHLVEGMDINFTVTAIIFLKGMIAEETTIHGQSSTLANDTTEWVYENSETDEAG